jgi:hypothetical protein
MSDPVDADLAERWGFRSRHDLLDASVSIASRAGQMGWIMPLAVRGWIAWTEHKAQMSDVLPTLP